MREQLHGTVKFIFQPAEEGVRGARAIVENGHLEDVDFLLAAHMYGGSEQHPCGICITAGHGLATTKLDVDFHGKASMRRQRQNREIMHCWQQRLQY